MHLSLSVAGDAGRQPCAPCCLARPMSDLGCARRCAPPRPPASGGAGESEETERGGTREGPTGIAVVRFVGKPTHGNFSSVDFLYFFSHWLARPSRPATPPIILPGQAGPPSASPRRAQGAHPLRRAPAQPRFIPWPGWLVVGKPKPGALCEAWGLLKAPHAAPSPAKPRRPGFIRGGPSPGQAAARGIPSREGREGLHHHHEAPGHASVWRSAQRPKATGGGRRAKRAKGASAPAAAA